MDRRTEQQFDSCFGAIIGGIFVLIIWLIKTLIGGIIGVVVKSGEKNPEDELRKFKSSMYQRQQIYGTACLECGTKNEEHQTHCYMCGSAMVKQVEKTSTSNNTTPIAVVVGTLFLAVVIVIAYTRAENNQRANVQASNNNNVAASSSNNNNAVSQSALPTRNSEEIEALLREYLDTVNRGECEKSQSYYFQPVPKYLEQCKNGFLKVNQIDSVSGKQANSIGIRPYAITGDFQIETETSDTLLISIFQDKVYRLPIPLETPTPRVTPTITPESTPTLTPEPTPTWTAQPPPTPEPPEFTAIRGLLYKYFNARLRGACDEAWSYFPRGVSNYNAFVEGCKGDGRLTEFQIHAVTLNQLISTPTLAVTGIFVFQNKETVISFEFEFDGPLPDANQINDGIVLSGCSPEVACLPLGGI